jgi:hypothetical protein
MKNYGEVSRERRRAMGKVAKFIEGGRKREAQVKFTQVKFGNSTIGQTSLRRFTEAANIHTGSVDSTSCLHSRYVPYTGKRLFSQGYKH